MVTVLFFASIRERLGVDRLSVKLGAATTLTDFMQQLVSQQDESWADVLMAANVICAVNQEVAGDGQMVADGDEVAFYPPVTGG